MTEFSEALTRAREALGHSRVNLARRVGVNRRVVAAWENGDDVPGALDFAKLCGSYKQLSPFRDKLRMERTIEIVVVPKDMPMPGRALRRGLGAAYHAEPEPIPGPKPQATIVPAPRDKIHVRRVVAPAAPDPARVAVAPPPAPQAPIDLVESLACRADLTIAGISSTKDLLFFTESDLLSIDGFDLADLDEVRAALAVADLRLPEPAPAPDPAPATADAPDDPANDTISPKDRERLRQAIVFFDAIRRGKSSRHDIFGKDFDPQKKGWQKTFIDRAVSSGIAVKTGDRRSTKYGPGPRIGLADEKMALMMAIPSHWHSSPIPDSDAPETELVSDEPATEPARAPDEPSLAGAVKEKLEEFMGSVNASLQDFSAKVSEALRRRDARISSQDEIITSLIARIEKLEGR